MALVGVLAISQPFLETLSGSPRGVVDGREGTVVAVFAPTRLSSEAPLPNDDCPPGCVCPCVCACRGAGAILPLIPHSEVGEVKAAEPSTARESVYTSPSPEPLLRPPLA